MARDAITITSLGINAATANPAGLTIDSTVVTNDMVVNASGNTRGLLLQITNTSGADKVVTVKAGDNPPAFRAGLGDLEITVPATSGNVWISLESARFVQDDGTINIDLATGHTGVARAFRLPKEAV